MQLQYVGDSGFGFFVVVGRGPPASARTGALFNAMNFSLGNYGYQVTTAGYAQVASLLCPSESIGQRPGYPWATSSYVGNYGGPGQIMAYSGTIVPPKDLLLNGSIGTKGWGGGAGVVRIASIIDGTSNTAVFSEHLIGLGVSGSVATMTPISPDAKRVIFPGTDSSAINTRRRWCDGGRSSLYEPAVHDPRQPDGLGLPGLQLVARLSHPRLPDELHARRGPQLASVRQRGRHLVCPVRGSYEARPRPRATTPAASMSDSPMARSASSRTRSTCRRGGALGAGRSAR